EDSRIGGKPRVVCRRQRQRLRKFASCQQAVDLPYGRGTLVLFTVATRHSEQFETERRQHEHGGNELPRHNSARYQVRIGAPTVAAAAAPRARNVPKGNAYFSPPRRVTISPR